MTSEEIEVVLDIFSHYEMSYSLRMGITDKKEREGAVQGLVTHATPGGLIASILGDAIKGNMSEHLDEYETWISILDGLYCEPNGLDYLWY